MYSSYSNFHHSVFKVNGETFNNSDQSTQLDKAASFCDDVT